MDNKCSHTAKLHANPLQDEIEDSSSRLLTDVCAVLLASNSQLQRLSVCPHDDIPCFGLPRPLMGMISMASSLEHLAVDIPYNHSMGMLAESISSLKNLKVHSSTLQLVCTALASSWLVCSYACESLLPVCAYGTSTCVYKDVVAQIDCLPVLH